MSAGEGNIAFPTRKASKGFKKTLEKGRRSDAGVIFSAGHYRKAWGVLDGNLLMLGFSIWDLWCRQGSWGHFSIAGLRERGWRGGVSAQRAVQLDLFWLSFIDVY